MTATQQQQVVVPMYDSYNDDFINDPNSMKFDFPSNEAAKENMLRQSCDCMEEEIRGRASHSKKKTQTIRIQYQNTKNPTRERPIPKKKKKKYQTKPKDHSKIAKLKASRTDAPACWEVKKRKFTKSFKHLLYIIFNNEHITEFFF